MVFVTCEITSTTTFRKNEKKKKKIGPAGQTSMNSFSCLGAVQTATPVNVVTFEPMHHLKLVSILFLSNFV